MISFAPPWMLQREHVFSSACAWQLAQQDKSINSTNDLCQRRRDDNMGIKDQRSLVVFIVCLHRYCITISPVKRQHLALPIMDSVGGAIALLESIQS